MTASVVKLDESAIVIKETGVKIYEVLKEKATKV